MIKFLHAADLHLDSPMRMLERYEGAPVDELRLATRQALTRLVEVALREKVDFLLLAGDLYDGDWRDYNTGLFFVRQMDRLEEAKIPVFLIAGNHDAASRMSRSIRLPANIKLFAPDRPSSVVLDELGIAIHGQSFAKAAVTTDLSQAYPEPKPGLANIGLLHTCAEGREGHERYAPCRVENLKIKGYDYWALGHIHRRETLSLEPLILFPGNTQGRHMRETGPKGAMLITLTPGDAPAAEFVPLAPCRWEQLPVDMRDETNEDDLFLRVEERLSTLCEQVEGLPTVVRLKIAGTTPAVRRWETRHEHLVGEFRAIARHVSSGNLWLEKVRWEMPSFEADGFAIDSTALGIVLEEWQTVSRDEEQLRELAKPLEDLLRKLPSELRVGDDAYDASDPAWVKNVLAEVIPILAERLGGAGEASR